MKYLVNLNLKRFVLLVTFSIMLASCNLDLSCALPAMGTTTKILEPKGPITVKAETQITFRAEQKCNQTISWSSTKGSFDKQSGAKVIFTAPSTHGVFEVTASSSRNEFSGTVAVTVN